MGWKIREGTDIPDYASNKSLFSIVFHHGGSFNMDSQIQYVNGFTDFIDYCDIEEMSYLALVGMAYNLGWFNVTKLYFKRVGSTFVRDLVEIKLDSDAKELNNHVDENRQVEVYCECDNGADDSSDGAYVVGDEEVEPELETNFGSDNDIGRDDDGLVNNVITGEDVVGASTASIVVEQIGGGASNASGSGKTTDTGKSKVSGSGVVKGKSKFISCGNDVGDDGIMEEGYNPHSDDDFHSINGSDEDELVAKHPTFGEADLNREIVFHLGMKFPTGQLFRRAVREYGIQKGKDVHFSVNSRLKMYVVCIEGCPWMIYCAKMRDEETVQIKTFTDNHTCSRTNLNRNCKPKYIAEKFLEDIRENPKWDVKAFQRHVARKTQCKVSLPKAYRSLHMAKQKMEGTSAEQYLMLWDYIEELKRTNPGSTFVMKVKNRAGPNGELVFKGLYVCWGALKRGFLEGCRPLIGVDGCHLSGPYKGILLTAVAIDPNNCMYHFAYAVVGQEKLSTWRWFLRLLCKDIGIESASEYTFISDKQKGLILAMEQLLPGVEHRFCVRHLYNNFKGLHKGLVLKDLLWKCARESTIPHFNRALEEMRVFDEAAYSWLASKPGENWSRSHFSTNPKSDLLLNNLCESFNSCIKEARCKPILSMLEDIRMYLMDCVMRKKEAMRKKNNVHICPKIQVKIEELKVSSHEWIPRWNGENMHEVQGPNCQMYQVDIKQMTCGCNVWQLTGIPCVHGVAAIHYMHQQPESYVHVCYTRETYLKTYSNVLVPINGRDLWPKTKNPTLLPPRVTVQPGRPKKKRRGGLVEEPTQKLSRHGMIFKCKKCGISGHNSRTCGKPPKVRKQGRGIRQSRTRVRGANELIDESDSEDDDEGQTAAKTTEAQTATESVSEAELREDGFVETEGFEEPIVNENIAEEEEEFWDTVAHSADDLWNMKSKRQCEGMSQTSRVVCNQPEKVGSAKRNINKTVRRSTRILNSPKTGPTIVEFEDFTKGKEKGSESLHVGILNRLAKGPRLPKGHIFKGGKRYTTLAALKADMEFKKKNCEKDGNGQV